MTTKKLLVLGECMAELDVDPCSHVKVCFSGDVYNSLVYAKRWHSDLEAIFITALGTDQLSELMKKDAQSNQIDLSLSLNDNNHNIGIYTISTDAMGESVFDYWRRDSAASQYFNLIPNGSIEQIAKAYVPGSILYFSGISVAIYAGSDKEKLLFYIAQLKKVGYKIAFDPNYREKLWGSTKQAIEYIERCYQLADIILPGLEDHQALFGHQSISEIEAYCAKFENTEVIIKGGSQGTIAISVQNVRYHTPYNPAEKQLDSTAAGDSFAGIYLVSRLYNKSIPAALKLASDVARFVVTHKGAIVAQDALANFQRTYLSDNI